MRLRAMGLVGAFLLLASVPAVPGAASGAASASAASRAALAAAGTTALVGTEDNYLGLVGGPAAAYDSLARVNARGDAAVAFARGGDLYVRSRPAGGTWRRAERVATGVEPGALTIDGRGRATVFWLDGPMWVRSRTRNGWSRKRALAGGDAGSFLSTDQNADGDLAAMYLTSTGLHLAYRSGTGRWRADQVLFGSSVQPLSLRVSLDERGRATATWVHARVGADLLRSARSGPRGRFGDAEVLSPAGGAVATADLDVNGAGDVAVAWVQSIDGDKVILVRTRKATGPWRRARAVAGGGLDPRIALGPAGETWVVWESPGTADSVLMTSRPAGGGDWTAPVPLATGPSITRAKVTAAENGAAVLTYQVWTDDGLWRLWYAYTPRVTSDFSAPQSVAHAGRSTAYSVSMTATGDALMTVTSRTGAWTVARAAAGPGPETHLWAVALDATGPVARMKLPRSPFSRSRQLRAAWAGFDVWSEIAGFRLSSITWAADGRDRRVFAVVNTTRQVADFVGTNGRTYCFQARATDTAGNTGGPSAKRCTAVPFDDRNLQRKGTWRRVHSRGSYDDTVLRSSRRGSALSATVATRRLTLIATRCPGCGDVAVYLGRRLLERVSLDAPTVRRGARIPVARFGQPRRGRVRVVVASAGRRVLVDGLATSVR